MANHAALKRLALLRDKLELRRDDIAVSQAALEDESRELRGRQEQLALVHKQIRTTVQEMEEIGRKGRARQAEEDEFKNEEVAIRLAFGTIIDQGLRQLIADRRKWFDSMKEEADNDTATREVSVLFEDEEGVFRIVDSSYTFDFLIIDACSYFEQQPLDMELVDDKDNVWPGDGSVRHELANIDNQYGSIILREKPKQEDDDDDDDGDDFMQLLLGKPEVNDDDDDDEEVFRQAPGASAPPEKSKRKKINRRQLIRELPPFAIFMLMFINSLFARRQVEEGYNQVNAIRTILVDENFGDFNEKAYMDIRNFEEVFDWVEGVLLEGIYPDSKYNDDLFSPREVGTVMTYNRVVGAIRMRTVRVQPNLGCLDAALNRRKVMNASGYIFDQRFVDKCYGDFNDETEERSPYSVGKGFIEEHGTCEGIPAPPPPPDKYTLNYEYDPPTAAALDAMSTRKLCRAFTYHTANETGESNYAGKMGSYSGGGYVRDIDNPVECRERPETADDPNPLGVCERGYESREDLLLAIEQLKDNRWLDQATRAMFIKVTFYNANLNYFMMINFVFEFSRGGTIYPSTRMSLVNQDMYSLAPEKLFNTIQEFILSAFVLYYLMVQLRLIQHSLKKTGGIGLYLSDIWNSVEAILLIAFLLSTYYRLLLFTELKPAAVIFENYYTDYATIGDLYMLSFNLDALCVIALFFKMLKYAQLNESTSMLWSVLERAGKDMAYFVVMLLGLMLAFAMMAYQFFGAQLRAYSTLFDATVSLLLVLLGQFDIEGMRQASPLLGVWFFFAYIVIMVLIMMNIFLAILGEAYSMIKEENDNARKNKVDTQRRSFLTYLKFVRSVLKAKWRKRKARMAGGKTGAKPKASRSLRLLRGPRKKSAANGKDIEIAPMPITSTAQA